jgi:hypothetical protein
VIDLAQGIIQDIAKGRRKLAAGMHRAVSRN